MDEDVSGIHCAAALSLLVVTKPALVLLGRVSVTQQPDEITGTWYF